MLDNKRKKYTHAVRYSILLAVCWTAIMAGIYILSAGEIDQQAEDEAVTQASVVWEKDVLYRRWSATHGGVYVPVSAQTPPNPFLTQVFERDIVTPSGRQLTLMNPAYMTRQVNELAAAEDDEYGHITSLNPIRPENGADPWETNALKAFEEGEREVTSIETIDGQPYLRLMRPMVTEAPCLKCHASQGYREGDIRGGVSISIPYSQIEADADSQKQRAGLAFSLIWLTGCCGIFLGAIRQGRGELKIHQARENLEIRIAERTRELQDANQQLGVELAERKHTEKTLMKSEQQFKEAQQIAQIGNWEWDAATDTTFWSQELYHILNFDPAKPSPSYAEHLKVYTQDSASILNATVENTMETGEPYELDLELSRPDATRRWIVARGEVKRDDSGAITGLRGTAQNITERKKSEEERKSLRAQLLQAQKMEAIGRLAGGIAHDINNFLTVIEGYTDLVLTELPEDSTGHQQLMESRKASESAANLARQLLIFSRREAMHPVPTNLNAVINDTMTMLRRLIGERYMLVTDLATDLWTVNADKSHIEQVIMNLAVNARDAMPDGGEIRIGSENFTIDEEYTDTHPESRIGDFVRVSVTDTGCGMDRGTLSHMYEPFFTTKGAAQGTGLGLSVVYGIISHHDGWIDVESSLGLGSTFFFFLPVIPLMEEASEAEMVSPDQLNGRGEKILLVEDEEAVRNLAERILSRAGYLVTTAPSAEEAMSIFNAVGGDFEMVFSDVVLPQENGIMLVERLLKEKASLKVLLASGYNDIEWQENIHSRGYPYIPKPYSMESILKKIRELLNSE